MTITINRPIVLTEVQTKKFYSVVIARNIDNKLSATVTFVVLNEAEEVIKEEVLFYTGEEYNAFWNSFSSGAFLYEELIKNEEDLELPNDIENDFLN